MAGDWTAVFLLAFIVMIIASGWGAVVLAMKWTREVAVRILLGLVLFGVFCVAGTTAIIAGCVALSPKLH